LRHCHGGLQKKVASPGHGILAMDESNATCGKRLDSIGLENTENNRRAYRELLVTTPGLGEYISGAILFEETLYQKTSKGPSMVEVLGKQGIVPGEARAVHTRPAAVCSPAGPAFARHQPGPAGRAPAQL